MQERIEEEEIKREEERRKEMATKSIIGTNFTRDMLVDMDFNVKKERKITTAFIKSAFGGLNSSIMMGKSGSGSANSGSSPTKTSKKPSMLD